MKTKKTKEAVSLIVLVLTIVIMIILAGVIVINLNNSGIIDRAKNAVSETNLKNMQELANVAWGEAYLSIEGEKTSKNLKSTMLEKLKGKGVSEEELDKYTFVVTTGGVEVGVSTGSNVPEEPGTETPDEEEPVVDPLNPSGIIPEGGVYIVNYDFGSADSDYREYITEDSIVYEAGDEFPETVSDRDLYVYGGYMYAYNRNIDIADYGWVYDEEQAGWGVAYDFDVEHGEQEIILETINGVPVTSMEWTYCLVGQVTGGQSDVNIVIPSTIKDMSGTFADGYVLSGTITIHANPTFYYSCFGDCDMSNITLTGTSTMLEELRATGGILDEEF